MNHNISKHLLPLLTDEACDRAMAITPEYDENITAADKGIRLLALQDIQDIFVPDAMSREIYMKLYFALVKSLKKKDSLASVRQANQNYNRICNRSYESIMGGSDTFTIIGPSGLGKSSAVSRSLSMLTESPSIETNDSLIIPGIQVQTPGDCSIKSLLKSILARIDETLGTNLLQKAERSRATTDMLIGSVSQAALHHVGIIVIDEIQHAVVNRNGKTMVKMLTQLINSSGVSICMVGTPDCIPFFEEDVVMARRALGLTYGKMEYDEEFISFCSQLLQYCYVKEKTEISDGLLLWLYNHSGGVKSNVVSLIMEAQRIAIVSDYEKLDIDILNKAFAESLTMLHRHILPEPTILPSCKREPAVTTTELTEDLPDESLFITAMLKSKKEGGSVIEELRKREIIIEEVAV